VTPRTEKTSLAKERKNQKRGEGTALRERGKEISSKEGRLKRRGEEKSTRKRFQTEKNLHYGHSLGKEALSRNKTLTLQPERPRREKRPKKESLAGENS